MTRVLIGLSSIITKQVLLWVGLILSTLILCCRGLRYCLWGRVFLEQLRDWTPGVGAFFKARVQVRILKVVGMLVASKVTLSSALKACGDLIEHSGYKRNIQQIRASVDNGMPYSKAWHDSNLRCPEVEALLALGETSGRLSNMMLHASKLIEERLSRNLERLVALLNPLILLFTGFLIAGLIGAIYVPLISLSSSFG